VKTVSKVLIAIAAAAQGAAPALADTILAVSQGHIDATVVTNTVAAASIKSGKYSKDLKIVGNAPYVIDYVSLVASWSAKRSTPCACWRPRA